MKYILERTKKDLTDQRILDGMAERQHIMDEFMWDCPDCLEINDYETYTCDCGFCGYLPPTMKNIKRVLEDDHEKR